MTEQNTSRRYIFMLKEFFGIGGYTREPEGYFSWQHLTFVSALMVIMVGLAILLAKRNKSKSIQEKNRVLIVAAILMDTVEIVKIVIDCAFSSGWLGWLNDLPLFLCSIQLITIPLAAFSKGRIKEASLDFVLIFGVLGAVLGTYAAGQNYSAYPVLSMDNVVSGFMPHSPAFNNSEICICSFDRFIMLTSIGWCKCRDSLPNRQLLFFIFADFIEK